MRRSRPELAIAIIAAIAALGCSRSRGETGGQASRCAGELTTWLEAARAEGEGVAPPLKFELVATDLPPSRPDTAHRLWLLDDGLELDGARVDDLGTALSGGGRILIFAGTRTPWSTIVDVAGAALQAGLSHLEIAVAARGAVEPPGRRPADGDFAGCPEARALAGARDVDRYVAAIGPAVEACGCAEPDVAAARATLWAWLGRFNGGPIATLSVELSDRGGVLVLDPDTPWSAAIDSIRPLETPVRLGLAP